MVHGKLGCCGRGSEGRLGVGGRELLQQVVVVLEHGVPGPCERALEGGDLLIHVLRACAVRPARVWMGGHFFGIKGVTEARSQAAEPSVGVERDFQIARELHDQTVPRPQDVLELAEHGRAIHVGLEGGCLVWVVQRTGVIPLDWTEEWQRCSPMVRATLNVFAWA